jgi:hypothetical protein
MKTLAADYKLLNTTQQAENDRNLIQLKLIVVACFAIALIAVIAVPSINFVVKSRQILTIAEQHQVETALMMYIDDGDRITSPSIVTPSDKGILAPYLQGNLSNSWIINPNGNISLTDNPN